MIRRPPRSTRTDTLCPYTTLFRSALDAGVAFYGRLTGKPDALHPKSPIDIVTDIKAPVLGQYGGLDRGIPVADVDAMRTALQAAGKPAELVVYPQADHGFMADYRPSYNEDAAEKAFAWARAWFRTSLNRKSTRLNSSH